MTMTVAQLREALAGYPDDSPVHLATPSHDHWGNVTAPGIDYIGQTDIEFSEYHRQDAIAREGVYDEEEDPDEQLGGVRVGLQQAPASRYVVILASSMGATEPGR